MHGKVDEGCAGDFRPEDLKKTNTGLCSSFSESRAEPRNPGTFARSACAHEEDKFKQSAPDPNFTRGSVHPSSTARSDCDMVRLKVHVPRVPSKTGSTKGTEGSRLGVTAVELMCVACGGKRRARLGDLQWSLGEEETQ